VGLFLFASLRGVRDMGPAVVADLVAGRDHRLALARIGLDGVSGNEPSRSDAPRFEEVDQSPRPERAELAARQRRRRGEPAGDEARMRIEVEGEANEVA